MSLVGRTRGWLTGWWPLAKQTLADWWEDKAPRLGASLAFYTVLSLAPLLVLVTPILATVLGDEAARQGIAKQFEQLVGPEGAQAIDVMLKDPDVAAAVVGDEAATQPAAAAAATTDGEQARRLHQAEPATRPATRPATTTIAVSDGKGNVTGQQTVAVHPPTKSGSPWPSRVAWVVSIVVLVFGATNVFAELQDSLNTIWEVTPKPGTGLLWDFVRARMLSFAMVMAIGFLLLVSLVFSALLQALQSYFADSHVQTAAQVWSTANNLASFAVVTVLFALMFRVLPDVRLRWRDVLAGALLTAVLFTVGRHLIGQYLGRVGVGQRYGASRSLVALLVWVYYSAQILFLGAEFTKVWSRRHGVRVVPTEVAVPVTEEARAQAGIAHKEVVEAVAEVVERKEANGEAEPGKTIRMENGQKN
jgi:YihY family inner membrane protein